MNRDNVLTGKGPLVGSPVSHIQTVSEKQETAQQKESSPRAGKDRKKNQTFKELMDEVKVAKNAQDQKTEKEKQQNLKTGKEKNYNEKLGLKKASKYQRATVTIKDIKEPLVSVGERTGSAETIVMTWEETRTDSQVRAMNEEIDRNQLFIRNWLEKLIQENKKLMDLEKLRDYLKTSLTELLKNNIVGCEIKMIDNTKVLVLKIRSGSSILNCEIREKENRKQGESPFVLAFSSSSQASPEETMEKILEENYKGNYNEDVPSGTIVQPKIQDWIFRKNNRFSRFAKSAKGSVCEPSSFLSSKKFSKDDESGLSVSLVVTEPDSVNDVDNIANAEKIRSEMIDQHIDDFIDNLPPNKDWTRLKYIFKAKFAEKKTITPKMAKIYLSRLEKMMINNDEIATNIMSKKVIMNFTETPLSATVTEIASSETSVLNFVKDITWAPLTYHKVDLFGDNSTPNSAEVSDTATQTILSMLAMAVGAVLYHVIKGIFAPPKDKEEIESNWIKAIKTFFIWFGSGMSIPGWNALQYIGRNIGLNQLNLSTNNAGYFSSLFPGIPDGPMQGITSIISANTVNHTWNKFQFKIFLQQLLIFVTFGAFPGAIWQLIYQVVTGPIGSYNLPNWAVTVILGFTLATVVYICNVAYGTAYERFINKSHLIIELEAVEGNMELRLDSLLMDNDFDSIVSYNGRVGAPRKTSIVIRRRYHRQSL